MPLMIFQLHVMDSIRRIVVGDVPEPELFQLHVMDSLSVKEMVRRGEILSTPCNGFYVEGRRGQG